MKLLGKDGSKGARVRAGWLATTIALAAVLVVSSWSNYRAARGAVQTLNTGQAEIHAVALRNVLLRRPPQSDIAVLDSVLASQSEAGLRAIALMEPDGTVSGLAGEPLGPVSLPVSLRQAARVTGPLLIQYEDRVRAFIPRGPDRIGITSRPPAGFGRDREQRLFVRFQGPPLAYYMLEFEPVPASNVVSQAVRGLFLNGLGAALLTLVAVGFWRLSREYEAAQRQIEQQRRLSQLGEMSAVLAHEIRNPLASLKGNAQLLAEGLTDEPTKERRALRVVSEAVRLEALTGDLLDFARSAPLNLTTTDPVELARTAAEEVSPSVAIQVEDAPPQWPLDRGRMRQALVNLIRNACQVSEEGRPPGVTVARQGADLVFEVRDSGPGIEPGDEERIFEPFYTTRTQGTGLGLSVARRAVEQHGGTLTVANLPSAGAAFRITLPPRED